MYVQQFLKLFVKPDRNYPDYQLWTEMNIIPCFLLGMPYRLWLCINIYQRRQRFCTQFDSHLFLVICLTPGQSVESCGTVSVPCNIPIFKNKEQNSNTKELGDRLAWKLENFYLSEIKNLKAIQICVQSLQRALCKSHWEKEQVSHNLWVCSQRWAHLPKPQMSTLSLKDSLPEKITVSFKEQSF